MPFPLPHPDARHPLLLVVDDDPANLRILGAALSDSFEILCATNGREALETARTGQPDLILLDILMPGMDGFETCRALKADPATRAIPVLFLTSLQEEADEVRGFEAGGEDFLTKPFRLPVVRARLRTHLELKRYRDFLEDCSHQERMARLRAEQELEIARSVQARLLPPIADLAPLVQAALLPAREVAGDYFDLFPLTGGRLAFVVADVSGKGTRAAFYAVELRGILRALDKEQLTPLEVAERLNEMWCGDSGRTAFATLAYGLFDPSSGQLAFVRAGHSPALLRRRDGRVERLEPPGIAVGFQRTGFRERTECLEARLEPGDAVLFYTDGLTEARSPGGEEFGEARLEALLAQPSPALLEHLRAGLRTFTEDAPPEDDLTLLVFQRPGPG